MSEPSPLIGVPISDKRRELLDLIDTFREIGVDEHVSLPRICVIGNQSSGKSTVLKRLTGISFPVASGLCTRFATEIVSRRTSNAERRTVASIGPRNSSKSNPQRLEELKEFLYEGKQFDEHQFAEIFQNASQTMGVFTEPGLNSGSIGTGKRSFSDEVLRIEIFGPEQQNLTFIDLPGLFHSSTNLQSKSDSKMVEDMVREYIEEKRTVILAVMDSQNDIATQAAFSIAEDCDKNGMRTIGVVTKCDRIEKGTEASLVKLVKNGTKKLNHGWFVLKNWSNDDSKNRVSIDKSGKLEADFFAEDCWSSLPKENVGIESLKKYLGGTVEDLICKEMVNVIRELDVKMKEVNGQIHGLGKARHTSAEQRAYLNDAALRYQTNVEDCLSASYKGEAASAEELHLRRLLANEQDKFMMRMEQEGCVKKFNDHTSKLDKNKNEKKLPGAPATPPPEVDSTGKDTQDIYQWLKEICQRRRGVELPGLLSTALVGHAFILQSEPWERIARDYISVVELHVQRFMSSLLQKILPDAEVRKALTKTLEPETEARNQAQNEALQNLIEDEKSGLLHTPNPGYSGTFQMVSLSRLEHHFHTNYAYMDSQCKPGQGVDLNVYIKTTVWENDEATIYRLHDSLQTYYNLEINNFTINVVRQVVERCFLGPKSALRLFHSRWVQELDDKDLARIAGESYDVTTQRNRLTKDRNTFQNALKLARDVAAY